MTGLGRAALVAALPVLLVQGHRVRRTTRILADATDPTSGDASAALVGLVGDSVAAGYGVASHRDTIAGRLAVRMGDGVGWRVVARTGATADRAADLVREQGADLVRARVVVVSIGVNDTIALHSDARFRTDVADLLSAVLAAAPEAEVAMLGVPPMGRFPALPAPLRALMGGRARRLDAIGRDVAAGRGRVHHLPLDGALDVSSADGFAADGFHPSDRVHDVIAERVHDLIRS